MRILHVIGTLNPAWGGPVEGVRNITAQALVRGHDVHIVTLDHPESSWLSSWKPKVHAVGKSTSIDDRYRYSPNLGPWLTAHLPGFDRVVVHSIWMYFSFAVWKAARKTEVPYYLFIHGALDPWFKRQYPLKDIKKILYWKLIEHKVLRDAAAVLFTTEEEMWLAQGAYSPYKCRPRVVGYGIAPPDGSQHFNRETVARTLTQSHPDLRNRRFLLFLGRLHEKKGLDLLLKAFAASLSLLPDMALVVAGAGDDKYVSQLKSLAASLGIAPDVIWTGPLYGAGKFDALGAADAFVLPSHQENFGISVVEALACGTPVLISDKVNIWREVDSSGAGLIAPDDEPGAALLLRRWSGLSPEQKGHMRSHAKACFEANFNMSVACERLFSVILSASEDAVDPDRKPAAALSRN